MPTTGCRAPMRSTDAGKVSPRKRQRERERERWIMPTNGESCLNKYAGLAIWDSRKSRCVPRPRAQGPSPGQTRVRARGPAWARAQGGRAIKRNDGLCTGSPAAEVHHFCLPFFPLQPPVFGSPQAIRRSSRKVAAVRSRLRDEADWGFGRFPNHAFRMCAPWLRRSVLRPS